MTFSLDAGECPPGYTFEGSSCYRYVNTPLAWFDAEKACEADAVGAHLVVVTDLAEALVLDGPQVASFWTGSTDRVTEGNYLNVTGGPTTFFAWSSGEPDGANQNCLDLDGTQKTGDRLCDTQLDYACEYDGVPADLSTY